MKKIVLLLLCAVAWSASSNAQMCVRDSSIYGTNILVVPAPWTVDSPYINTLPACIGSFYAQSVTLNVPDSASVPILPFPIPINSISLSTSGAISGLPAGLTYLCDPPNCVFNKNTLGCLLIYGTPTSLADTFELSITISISSPISTLPIPVAFPGTVAPGSKYFIEVREAGQCASGTDDLSGRITSVKNAPNPFGDQTLIQIESNVDGEFQFDVFDLTGRRVHSQNVSIAIGSNQFTFEAGDLPNGAYYFTFGSDEGKVTRKMVIAR